MRRSSTASSRSVSSGSRPSGKPSEAGASASITYLPWQARRPVRLAPGPQESGAPARISRRAGAPRLGEFPQPSRMGRQQRVEVPVTSLTRFPEARTRRAASSAASVPITFVLVSTFTLARVKKLHDRLQALALAHTFFVGSCPFTSNILFEQFERGLRHSLSRNRGHAAMVDRTVAQHARAALDRLRTMTERGPAGAVAKYSVGPKIATVGTASAEATCMAPESLVRNTRQAAASSMKRTSVVSPARFSTGRPARRMASAIAWHSRCSAGEPKSTIAASREAARRRALSTNRSGNHCFARLFWAPGSPRRLAFESPWSETDFSPLQRASTAA